MTSPATPTDIHARQYDLTLRAIVNARPEDYIHFILGESVRLVELLDPNLPASERVADWAVLIEHPTEGKVLLHGEFQTEYDGNIPYRMLEYRARLATRYPAYAGRIYSVVLYLTSDGHPGDGYNQVEETVLGVRQLSFQFHEVRLWEIPAQEVLDGKAVGLFPLLPLMQGMTEEMLPVAVRSVKVIEDEKLRADLLVGLSVLGELRFSRALLERIIRREEMKPNLFIEELLEEGREEGMLRQGREAVLRVLRCRFRRVSKRLEKRIGEIKSLPQLDELLDRAVTCADMKEFVEALPD